MQKLIDNAALHDRDASGKLVVWKDKYGHGVSVVALKGVLNAILVNYPNMFPSIATIAGRCGQKQRTIQRAIEVLQAQEIIVVEQTRNSRGAKQNRYSILTTKLSYLGQDSRLPLFEKAKCPQAKAICPRRQVLVPPGPGPSAPGGTLRVIVRTSEDQRKRGGDSEFENDEIQEVIQYAKQQGKIIGPTVGDQGECLLKCAVWRMTGEISENDFEECLESVGANNPDDNFAYYWTSIKNRIEQSGRDFYRLLKETRIP